MNKAGEKSKSKSAPAPRAGALRKAAAGTASTAKRSAGSRAKPDAAADAASASGLIDQRIRDLGGWRGETLARMRALIVEADAGITEEWKWMNPVWSHGGIVCTGEAYRNVVKLTFAHGAGLADPSQLFNSSLAGATRRAIDIREGDQVDARAFRALVTAAVARNAAARKKK